MGGNAIKISRRYQFQEYYIAQKEIETVLQNSGFIYYFVRPYSQKQDFGDMDILIQKQDSPHFRNEIVDLFSYQEIYKSGEVWSINYQELQVDFIFISPQYWELSKWFFDFNDLGALVGKIARFMKLKFGFQGLEFELFYREKKHTFLISTEPVRIFEFLGFDIQRYMQGFSTLAEIFEYVASSKYFNNTTFEKVVEKENQKALDTQRPTYQKFLDYIKNKNIVLQRPAIEEVLLKVDTFFQTDLQQQVINKQHEIDYDYQVHEKFNGNHVIEHLGITGKELGNVMQQFNVHFTNKKEKQDFIMTHSLIDILALVKSFIS